MNGFVLNDFKLRSVRPELVEGLRRIFSILLRFQPFQSFHSQNADNAEDRAAGEQPERIAGQA